jgi:hypothetical protein
MFSGEKIHQNFDFLIFDFFFPTTFELRFYLLAIFLTIFLTTCLES